MSSHPLDRDEDAEPESSASDSSRSPFAVNLIRVGMGIGAAGAILAVVSIPFLYSRRLAPLVVVIANVGPKIVMLMGALCFALGYRWDWLMGVVRRIFPKPADAPHDGPPLAVQAPADNATASIAPANNAPTSHRADVIRSSNAAAWGAAAFIIFIMAVLGAVISSPIRIYSTIVLYNLLIVFYLALAASDSRRISLFGRSAAIATCLPICLYLYVLLGAAPSATVLRPSSVPILYFHLLLGGERSGLGLEVFWFLISFGVSAICGFFGMAVGEALPKKRD